MCAAGADDVRALKNYTWCTVLLQGDVHAMVARTGYTGEDGFELFVVPADAVEVWRLALALGEPEGLIPCGLSARDTLRLEAGMPLYGHELTLATTPYDAGLSWVVQTGAARVLERPGLDGAVSMSAEPVARGDFVGREALAAAKERAAAIEADPASAPEEARILVGLVGSPGRAARAGFAVFMGDASGGDRLVRRALAHARGPGGDGHGSPFRRGGGYRSRCRCARSTRNHDRDSATVVLASLVATQSSIHTA